jgi:hypothetical protein
MLLREFFRAEMPAAWPPAPAAPTRRSRPRGRYALAASLLVLLAGNLYLADRFTSDEPTPDRGAGKVEATRRNLNGQPRRPTEKKETTKDAENTKKESSAK